MSVVCVGDIVTDVAYRVEKVPLSDEKVFGWDLAHALGGVATNAAAASRLAGSATRLLGSIGADAYGDDVVTQLEELDIELASDARTGTSTLCFIAIEANGEKRITILPGSGMYPTEEMIAGLELSDASWVHTAVYDLKSFLLLAERCRAQSVRLSVDLEPTTFDSIVEFERIVSAADLLFVNLSAREKVRELKQNPATACASTVTVLSNGSQGASLMIDGTEVADVAAPKIADVVDTTGAGDCLAGSMIARLDQGESYVDALGYGVTAASLSCGRVGTIPSYATRERVLQEWRREDGGVESRT